MERMFAGGQQYSCELIHLALRDSFYKSDYYNFKAFQIIEPVTSVHLCYKDVFFFLFFCFSNLPLCV